MFKFATIYPSSFLSLLRRRERDLYTPSNDGVADNESTESVELKEPGEDSDEFHSAEENLIECEDIKRSHSAIRGSQHSDDSDSDEKVFSTRQNFTVDFNSIQSNPTVLTERESESVHYTEHSSDSDDSLVAQCFSRVRAVSVSSSESSSSGGGRCYSLGCEFREQDRKRAGSKYSVAIQTVDSNLDLESFDDLESDSSINESSEYFRSETSLSSGDSTSLDFSIDGEGAGDLNTAGKNADTHTIDFTFSASGDQYFERKLCDKNFELGEHLPLNSQSIIVFPLTYIRQIDMNPELKLESKPLASAVTKKYEHAWNTLDQLYKMYRDGKLCDVVVCVDKFKFSSHKVMLATHSEYFERIFSDANFRDLGQDEIVLNANITPEAFERVLHYVYSSDIDITYETIYDILSTASLLLMKRLIKMCTDFLRNFDFEHCLTALYIADRAGLKDVYTEILGFVTENFLEVANLEEFLRYPPERLTRLLADDDLCVENEIQVFHVALQWIEANGEMGMRYAPAIMKQIRFGLMSPEEIVQNVESVNFLMDLPECHVLILEAFRYFSLRACHKGSLRPHPINPRKGMNKVRNARRASIAIPDEIVSHGKKILGVPTPFALASKIGSREDSELTSTGGLVKIEPVTVQKPLQENRPALSPDKECILCSGGINTVADVDNPGRMVNCFDPLQNSWSKLTEMPYPRNHHAAQFVNGYLYIIGGSDPNAESEEFMSPMSTACRYDIASKKWEDIAPMKTSRVFFQVAVLYGQLYVVGGQDAKGRILSSVERYDSATNTWRYTASLSSPRYAVSVAPHRGMLFAVGGYNDNGKTPVLSTVECYDPHSDLWTEKSPLRYARCHASMADVVGKLYLFGGMVKTNSSDEDCRSLPSVDVYVDNDDTWEYVTDLSEARHESSVAVLGTKVFIIGGISAMEKQVLSSVECYDALTGQWQSPNVPSLPRPAFGHSCCIMTIKQS